MVLSMIIIFMYVLMFFFAAVTSIISNAVGVAYLTSLITFSLIFVISHIFVYIVFELFEQKEKEYVYIPVKSKLFFLDE